MWKNSIWYDNNGFVRWIANDRIPSDIILEYFEQLGYPVDTKKCARQREIEIRNTLHQYADWLRNYIPMDDDIDDVYNIDIRNLFDVDK